MYRKEVGTFPSSNGVNEIKYYIYVPDEIKAKIQLVHGMCEYIERYEPFIEFLTDQGFLVYGCDHLGHKGSVRSKAELGYFADQDGWKCLVKDQHRLLEIMEERYSMQAPLILYGHSMGSFVARAFAANFPGDIDGAVFSGSAGYNPALKAGRTLANIVERIRGKHSISALLTFLMFGAYNKRYQNPRTSYDWISRDPDIVDAYMADEYCMFLFQTRALVDLMSVLNYVTSDEWYERLDPTLPVLFISGDMDPVGDYGAGLADVDARMKRVQRKDYTMRLYKGMRHEVHNEIGKETVWQDVADWINERLS